MRILTKLARRTALAAGVGAILSMATAGQSRAEVTVYTNDTWTISLDGRTAAFYSYEFGDSSPHFTPAQIAANGGPIMMKGNLVWSGFTDAANQDPAMCAAMGVANGQVCSFSTSRLHSGFVGNLFGFTAKKKISPTLTGTGHISIWWPIETDQYRGYSSMSPDPRESYLKLEGPWGGLLAGRALGLHDRGGTMIDFLYADGYSIGSPCSATGQGPLCGFIGYGYQFPGFNAAIVYNTPLAGGFQLSAGIYDPVRVGQSTVTLSILPVPRVESEATYTYQSNKFFLTVYLNGMWQQASGYVLDTTGANVRITRQAYGASYGGRMEVGAFKIGVGGNYDIGGGDTSGLVGSVPIDDTGTLRRVTGYLGQVMYSLGRLDLAAGAGITMVQQTASDVTNENSVIKTRLGESGTVTYHLDASVALNAQFFHAQHEFWRGQFQQVSFAHTGVNFLW